jgi:HNH endonuclease
VSAPFAGLRMAVILRSRSAVRKRILDARVGADTAPVDVDTRLFVWQRDGGSCRNCGSRQDLHFDHVVPRSWGGASTVDNVHVLCSQMQPAQGSQLGRRGLDMRQAP